MHAVVEGGESKVRTQGHERDFAPARETGYAPWYTQTSTDTKKCLSTVCAFGDSTVHSIAWADAAGGTGRSSTDSLFTRFPTGYRLMTC